MSERADHCGGSGVTTSKSLLRPLLLPVGVTDGSTEAASFALPAGTVTFLLSDIEGSTKLWEAHPEAMRAAVPEHYEILSEAVARHDGVRPVEQGEGDSVVAAFSRASDALAAALDAQRALHARSWPEGIELRVRIALHTAEAQLRDEGNYFGVALSRCARIRAIAHGGQTLLSRPTHDLVVDRMPEGISLIDCGEHRLRDLGRPEQVFALAHPDLPDGGEPLRSLDSLPNNLPSQLTSFVGRQRELGELRDALPSTRLLTLTGAGGTGKTRLALQLAAECVDGFPDGVWWVELASQTDPELVGDAIAKALGVHALPGATALQSVCAHLEQRSALVVLDNCEHLLETCAHVAAALLETGPEVTVLATSRAPLGLGGETDWRVPALTLPTDRPGQPIEALAQSDAVQLFIQRAMKVRPNFVVTNDNAPAVAQLCSDLDGIPLAIELAAARVRVLSVEQITAGLGDRFHMLTGGARTALPRQQTLRASVDWSHELLSEPEQALFRRLSTFIGGFTLDAAEEVCGHEQLDRYMVLDLLTALVDKSLVLAEETGAAVRYRMLETIRQYAVERLLESDERNAIRDRHRDAMLALAEAAAPDLETNRQVVWLPVLDLEAGNLAAALDRALETDARCALALATAQVFYWTVRARHAQGARSLEVALDAAGERWPELRGQALWARAHLLQYTANFAAVLDGAQQALALAEACGDRRTIARSLGSLGAIRRWPDPVGARPGLERAIAIARETGDHWCVVYASCELAGSYLEQSKHAQVGEVLAAHEDLLELTQTELVVRRWYWYAWVHMDRAELPDYWALAERSLAATREIGDVSSEGTFLQMAAFVDIYQGRPEVAIEKLEPMLRRFVERKVGYALPFVVTWLAVAESQVGQLELARGRLERLVKRGIDGGYVLAFALGALSEVLRLAGDPTAAAERARQGLELVRPLDSPAALVMPARTAARLALDCASWTEAEQVLHEVLALAAERRVWVVVPDVLDGLAEVAGGLQSHEEATRLIGAIDAARDALGMPVFRTEQPRRQALIETVRAGLGEADFERAYAEGAAMDLDETVAYVRRARGERKRPPRGWESLTPTELRVVELACDGLTNAAIGERMFISGATVKVHLAHVYAKLGVPNRAALATAAAARR
jgi:predicted ATPase/class 3 adenylate cyclase/DNA-binding CsgD family transcriptional regulator